MNFRTTRWSLVLAARSPQARRALSELCTLYWYPLYCYARRRGSSPSDAEDLTQGFFASLLARQMLERADSDRGTFRSFLIGSFKHYLSNQRSRDRAKKRRPDQTTLSLDRQTAEEQYRLEPVDSITPEDLYEKSWALAVLDRSVTRLQGEYLRRGKGELFEALKIFLTGTDGSVSQAEIGGQLSLSAAAVKFSVHKLRKRFRALIREEIADTVHLRQELDQEMAFFLRILRKRAQRK